MKNLTSGDNKFSAWRSRRTALTCPCLWQNTPPYFCLEHLLQRYSVYTALVDAVLYLQRRTWTSTSSLETVGAQCWVPATVCGASHVTMWSGQLLHAASSTTPSMPSSAPRVCSPPTSCAISPAVNEDTINQFQHCKQLRKHAAYIINFVDEF